MSLRKMVEMEGGIDDLQFQIKPKSLVFQGSLSTYFTLYLEKGVQVLGTFPSGNRHNLKESLFKFKNVEGAKFRLKNLSHATYTWNFYKINPADQSEEFLDSVTFNLKRSIELYQSELREKQRQIQTTFKEKNINKKVILQTWKKIKREMRTNRPTLKCIFHKEVIHLEFQLDISNTLDLAISAEEQSRYQMRRSRSEPGQLRPQSENQIGSKSKIADPLIIKDQHEQVNKLLNQVKAFPYDQKLANKIKGSAIQNQEQKYLPKAKVSREEECEAIVTVMNPNGVKLNIDADQYEFNRWEDNHKLKVVPVKKFSMLSDIIERSHEGSSSYGGPDKISSTDKYPDKKDQIVYREIEQPKNLVDVESPLLNKFKTLPHDRYKQPKVSNNLKVDLRRAQTAQKPNNNLEQSEYFNTDNDPGSKSDLKEGVTQGAAEKMKLTSGDPYAKYIILVAFLIIIGIVGHQLLGGCRGKNCKKNTLKKKQLSK